MPWNHGVTAVTHRDIALPPLIRRKSKTVVTPNARPKPPIEAFERAIGPAGQVARARG